MADDRFSSPKVCVSHVRSIYSIAIKVLDLPADLGPPPDVSRGRGYFCFTCYERRAEPSSLFSFIVFFSDQKSSACLNKAEKADMVQTSRYWQMINSRFHFRLGCIWQDISPASGCDPGGGRRPGRTRLRAFRFVSLREFRFPADGSRRSSAVSSINIPAGAERELGVNFIL